MCHEDKPASEFAFRSIATGELQSHCRKCHAAYRRQHYLDNREIYIAREAARIKAFRADNRLRLFEYLLAHPCVDCGETDVLVLEFDHREPGEKKWNVAVLAAKKPWKFVLREIEKCDVRCANCHRKRTASQFNWRKARRMTLSRENQLPEQDRHTKIDQPISQGITATADSRAVRRCIKCGELKALDQFYVRNRKTGRRSTICRACQNAYGRQHYRDNKAGYLARGRKNKREYRRSNGVRALEYLVGKSCADCGETDPVVLEFDHRDGVRKEDDVAHLMAAGQWEKVLEEIAKCDVRCANCHRRRTAEQFGWTKRVLQMNSIAKAS